MAERPRTRDIKPWQMFLVCFLAGLAFSTSREFYRGVAQISVLDLVGVIGGALALAAVITAVWWVGWGRKNR